MKKAKKKPAAKAGAKKMKSKAKPKSKMSAKAKTQGRVKAKGKTPSKTKTAGKKAAPKKTAAKRGTALKLVSLPDLAQDAMQTQMANAGAGPQAAHPPKMIPPHELTQNKAAFKAKAPKNVRNNRTNGAGARHH